ncbi:MAG TPA: hypothetical protein PKD37_01400 [Oligoflexia bacterium]|nr:hypothetical protein [Oligoflexia bacterium]HMP26632.1 hypothetical protein [Oligoflexia bacterium]
MPFLDRFLSHSLKVLLLLNAVIFLFGQSIAESQPVPLNPKTATTQTRSYAPIQVALRQIEDKLQSIESGNFSRSRIKDEVKEIIELAESTGATKFTRIALKLGEIGELKLNEGDSGTAWVLFEQAKQIAPDNLELYARINRYQENPVSLSYLWLSNFFSDVIIRIKTYINISYPIFFSLLFAILIYQALVWYFVFNGMRGDLSSKSLGRERVIRVFVAFALVSAPLMVDPFFTLIVWGILGWYFGVFKRWVVLLTGIIAILFYFVVTYRELGNLWLQNPQAMSLISATRGEFTNYSPSLAQRVIARYRSDPVILYGALHIFKRYQLLEDASQIAEEIYKLVPETWFKESLTASLLILIGDKKALEEAMVSLKNAISGNQNDLAANFNLSKLIDYDLKFDEKKNYLTYAHKLAPEFVERMQSYELAFGILSNQSVALPSLPAAYYSRSAFGDSSELDRKLENIENGILFGLGFSPLFALGVSLIVFGLVWQPHRSLKIRRNLEKLQGLMVFSVMERVEKPSRNSAVELLYYRLKLCLGRYDKYFVLVLAGLLLLLMPMFGFPSDTAILNEIYPHLIFAQFGVLSVVIVILVLTMVNELD